MQDLLDFCISKGIFQNYIDIKSSLNLSLDHSPIILLLNTQLTAKTIQIATKKATRIIANFEKHFELSTNIKGHINKRLISRLIAIQMIKLSGG